MTEHIEDRLEIASRTSEYLFHVYTSLTHYICSGTFFALMMFMEPLGLFLQRHARGFTFDTVRKPQGFVRRSSVFDLARHQRG